MYVMAVIITSFFVSQYYCKGGIKKHLASLGFPSVINEPVDCYICQREKKLPMFDAILTNPPFSADHISRAVHFAMKSSKPFAMLLPNNVFLRDWFKPYLNSFIFLSPHERYSFEVADSSKSQTKGELHSPLATMWYISGFEKNDLSDIVISWEMSEQSTKATLAQTPDELPRRIRKLLPFTKVVIKYF